MKPGPRLSHSRLIEERLNSREHFDAVHLAEVFAARASRGDATPHAFRVNRSSWKHVVKQPMPTWLCWVLVVLGAVTLGFAFGKAF